MRGETLIFVCFYGWVVCPLKPGLYKVNGRSARVTPGHTRPPGRLPSRKNTQKSKFLLSQFFKWKKNMFFVIHEMPSKTFVMLYKKIPDHFNLTISVCVQWCARRVWSQRTRRERATPTWRSRSARPRSEPRRCPRSLTRSGTKNFLCKYQVS